MSEEEISEMRFDPEAWQTIKLVEQRFAEESSKKHQAWIDAGKPLNKGGRCNAGHWRKDPGRKASGCLCARRTVGSSASTSGNSTSRTTPAT